MYLRFLEDFDFKPTRSTTIAYKAGMELTVRRLCGEQAVALGKAVELPAPARGATLDKGRDPASQSGSDREEEGDGTQPILG